MQERTPISSMDLKICISNMRKNPRFTEEIIQLVQDDLSFGLTKEETEEYTERKYDFKQMQVYSQCLRKGIEKDARAIIASEGLSGEQMAVALEFYEKGISPDTIKSIVTEKENTAFAMRKLFQNVLSKMQATGNVLGEEELYAKKLLEQIETVVSKIEYQENRYDALNEKLRELQNTKSDTEIQNNLLKQLQEKDGLLEKQQNEINEARVTIARLKNQLNEIEKEKESLEQKKTESPEKKEKEPITYQTAVIDNNGRIVQMVSMKETKKKSKGSLTAIFSQILFKKKIDIIRLLAEKNLSSGQLIQIRMGIEKGLTEQQLMVLINNNVPSEQMEEIINIAVYENLEKGD